MASGRAALPSPGMPAVAQRGLPPRQTRWPRRSCGWHVKVWDLRGRAMLSDPGHVGDERRLQPGRPADRQYGRLGQAVGRRQRSKPGHPPAAHTCGACAFSPDGRRWPAPVRTGRCGCGRSPPGKTLHASRAQRAPCKPWPSAPTDERLPAGAGSDRETVGGFPAVRELRSSQRDTRQGVRARLPSRRQRLALVGEGSDPSRCGTRPPSRQLLHPARSGATCRAPSRKGTLLAVSTTSRLGQKRLPPGPMPG